MGLFYQEIQQLQYNTEDVMTTKNPHWDFGVLCVCGEGGGRGRKSAGRKQSLLQRNRFTFAICRKSRILQVS